MPEKKSTPSPMIRPTAEIEQTCLDTAMEFALSGDNASAKSYQMSGTQKPFSN